MKHNLKLIMKNIGDWITRNSNRNSLITITRAEYSVDGKKLHFLYTVIPENQERPAQEFLTRHADDIRDYVKKTMKTQPAWFRFQLDSGERNRERISDLLDGTTDSHGDIPDRLHK